MSLHKKGRTVRKELLLLEDMEISRFTLEKQLSWRHPLRKLNMCKFSSFDFKIYTLEKTLLHREISS